MSLSFRSSRNNGHRPHDGKLSGALQICKPDRSGLGPRWEVTPLVRSTAESRAPAKPERCSRSADTLIREEEFQRQPGARAAPGPANRTVRGGHRLGRGGAPGRTRGRGRPRSGQLHRSGQASLIFYGAPANAGIPLKGPTRKPLPMTESPPGFPKLCRMASLGWVKPIYTDHGLGSVHFA